MKLSQYDQEEINYYILRGFNSNAPDVIGFEVEIEVYPTSSLIEQIMHERKWKIGHSIDTIEIQEVKSKITRYIIEEI